MHSVTEYIHKVAARNYANTLYKLGIKQQMKCIIFQGLSNNHNFGYTNDFYELHSEYLCCKYGCRCDFVTSKFILLKAKNFSGWIKLEPIDDVK